MSGSMSSVLPGLPIARTAVPPPTLWQHALGLLQGLLLHTHIGRVVLLVFVYKLYKFVRRQRKQQFSGRLFLVTGAANGIGRALTLALAARGANVALWDIDAAALENAAKLVRQAAPSVQVYADRVDLSSRDEIVAAAQSLQARGGFVHGVINNAGIVSGQPFLSLSHERILKSMQVNALAHMWVLQSLLPAMVEQNRGHIVAMTSAAGLFGAPLMTDYAASKFAAVGFHESVRLELQKMGKGGIHTTLVCPAHVDTRLFKGYAPGMFQRTLTPQELALSIVEAIENRDELVLSPWAVGMGYFIRGCLPVWMEDRIKAITGLNASMDHWRGVNGS